MCSRLRSASSFASSTQLQSRNTWDGRRHVELHLLVSVDERAQLRVLTHPRVALQQQRRVVLVGDALHVDRLQVLREVRQLVCVEEATDDVGRLDGADRLDILRHRLVERALLVEIIAVATLEAPHHRHSLWISTMLP